MLHSPAPNISHPSDLTEFEQSLLKTRGMATPIPIPIPSSESLYSRGFGTGDPTLSLGHPCLCRLLKAQVLAGRHPLARLRYRPSVISTAHPSHAGSSSAVLSWTQFYVHLEFVKAPFLSNPLGCTILL
ncbi:hypothetical protein MHYP_G00028250 [Metynnis hypsauchen]